MSDLNHSAITEAPGPGACFRFFNTLLRFEIRARQSDWRRKSRPNCALFDPLLRKV